MSNFCSKINKCSQEFKKIITPRHQQLFGEHYFGTIIKETLFRQHYWREPKKWKIYSGNINKGIFLNEH